MRGRGGRPREAAREDPRLALVHGPQGGQGPQGEQVVEVHVADDGGHVDDRAEPGGQGRQEELPQRGGVGRVGQRVAVHVHHVAAAQAGRVGGPRPARQAGLRAPGRDEGALAVAVRDGHAVPRVRSRDARSLAGGADALQRSGDDRGESAVPDAGEAHCLRSHTAGSGQHVEAPARVHARVLCEHVATGSGHARRQQCEVDDHLPEQDDPALQRCRDRLPVGGRSGAVGAQAEQTVGGLAQPQPGDSLHPFHLLGGPAPGSQGGAEHGAGDSADRVGVTAEVGGDAQAPPRIGGVAPRDGERRGDGLGGLHGGSDACPQRPGEHPVVVGRTGGEVAGAREPQRVAGPLAHVRLGRPRPPAPESLHEGQGAFQGGAGGVRRAVHPRSVDAEGDRCRHERGGVEALFGGVGDAARLPHGVGETRIPGGGGDPDGRDSHR